MSRRSTVLLGALCLLILLTGSAHSPRHNESSRRAAVRSALAAALGPDRYLEGRLVGFPYAPFNPSRPRISKELRLILRDIEGGSVVSSPEDIAILALAKLVGGKTRQAVEEFERAVAAAPTNAALLSDLTVAYLADARENQEPASLVKALESAEQAVELDSRLPEALFNSALARESLHLDEQARIAWTRFLEIDGGSGWSTEARERLAALPEAGEAKQRWETAKRELDAASGRGDSLGVTRVVARFPQASREYAEDALLGDWAEACMEGNTKKARETLASARAIGAALRQRNGERMISDTVAMIVKGPRLEALAEGHRSYRQGLELYKKGQLAEAQGRFQHAEHLLAQAGSPFAGWASFWLAVGEMQQFHYDLSLERLERLREANRSYRSLTGRSYWITGLIQVIQARPTEALAAYRDALRVFDRLGEGENRAIVNALTAESLWNSGDLRRALFYHLSALSSIRDLREPQRRQVVLEGSGLTALSLGEPLAALAFQQEVLDGLAGSANIASWIYGLQRRALIEIRAGQTEQARQDLAAARSRLAEISDVTFRESLLGDLLAVESQLYSAEKSRDIAPTLSKIIDIYRNTRYQKQLGLFLGRRARAFAALGRLDLAEADYAEAIRAITQQHEATSQRDLRAWYLAGSRAIFQEMIQLQAQRGEAEKALSFAESGRTQLFRDGPPEQLAALGAAEISARIPPGVALVEFWVADRRLHSWVVRRGSITPFSTPIVPGALEGRIGLLRREITRAQGSEWKEASRALFALLIGPIELALRGAKTVVLVPDGDLYELPFAALLDPADRYLIESYALVVSPSASLYVRTFDRARKRSSQPAILALGDPAVDRGILRNLSSLPQARKEAIRIAALYPQASLRLGVDATKQALFDGLASYDIVHFAGHAVVNATEPSMSFLAMAPSGRDSGILYARDLYDLPSSACRLVVLSACNSLLGDFRAGEGLTGLARPFLSSGIPAVVGSLWQVDDFAAVDLFVRFYDRVGKGTPAHEALRQAQIEMLKSSDSRLSAVASWAGFELLGGMYNTHNKKERT